MLIFKRNQIVISALIVVILCAGFLNYKYNQAKLTSGTNPIGSAYFVDNIKGEDINSDELASVAKVNGDYFIVTRAEKERARDEQKETMQSVINNKNSDKEAKDKAQAELIRISKNTEKEMVIEGVLKGKGFGEAIAFINDNKIDIVIKDDTNLISSQQAMILDVVNRETGITAENTKINPYKNGEDMNKKQ